MVHKLLVIISSNRRPVQQVRFLELFATLEGARAQAGVSCDELGGEEEEGKGGRRKSARGCIMRRCAHAYQCHQVRRLFLRRGWDETSGKGGSNIGRAFSETGPGPRHYFRGNEGDSGGRDVARACDRPRGGEGEKGGKVEETIA